MKLPSAIGSPRPLARLAQRLGSCGLAFGLTQMLRTTRVRLAWYDPAVDPARPEYNEHCIFVFWHENLSILLPQWSFCPVTLLISQHRDAHWLTNAADLLGFNVVRGSSTRGGSQAIRQLRQLRTRTSFAITPDGPRGPRRQMALGALFLASRLRMPLVPVGVGFSSEIRLNTWDRFAIPKPFSAARIVFGPKIRLPDRLSRGELEACRSETQTLLENLNGFATDWALSGARVRDEKPFRRARRCLELELPLAGTRESGHSGRRAA